MIQITFHTFRHWKATMEYHKTRDIIHVKEVLGHKSLNNTILYTQLIGFKDDEWIARVAHAGHEACESKKQAMTSYATLAPTSSSANANSS